MSRIEASAFARSMQRIRVLVVRPGQGGRQVVVLLAAPVERDVHWNGRQTVPCTGPLCPLCTGWTGTKGYAPCAARWMDPSTGDWLWVPRILEATDAALQDLQPDWIGKTLLVEREGEKRNSRLAISLSAQQLGEVPIKPFDAIRHMERVVWQVRTRNNAVEDRVSEPRILTMPGRTG